MCGAFGTFAHQAYAARLRGQLSSNVRPRNRTSRFVHRKTPKHPCLSRSSTQLRSSSQAISKAACAAWRKNRYVVQYAAQRTENGCSIHHQPRRSNDASAFDSSPHTSNASDKTNSQPLLGSHASRSMRRGSGWQPATLGGRNEYLARNPTVRSSESLPPSAAKHSAA